MKITKEMLDEYCDALAYAGELETKVNRLATEIDRLEKRLVEIESGEIVTDSVSGGEGGTQHFKITGVPTKEYHEKKNRLMLKKLSYNQLSPLLRREEERVLELTIQVEKFISEIDDITVKRIINFRYIENMSWCEVASVMGGGNTDESVKKIFYRFMDKTN